MRRKRLKTVYRALIGGALVYVLWMLVPEAQKFAGLITIVPRSETANAASVPRTPSAARRDKLNATDLESSLLASKQFTAASQVHCEPARQVWDYVCSFMGAPRESTTRLQFGVSVDATRWVKVSGIVPMGAKLPPPPE